MLILILLTHHVYKRVPCFHDLYLSYFCSIKTISWITFNYLQFDIYKDKKPCLYVHEKQTSTNFPALITPHQLNEKVYLSCLCYPLSLTCQSYPNTAVAVKGNFIQLITITLVSQDHKDFYHKENNVITLKQSDCKSYNHQLNIGIFRNLWLQYSIFTSF